MGADLIAGFPTETEEMFQNSLRHVQDCHISFVHVFPYSPRAGTPAAKMPQLPVEIRRERANLLRQLGDRQRQNFFARQLGKIQKVLIEKQAEDYSIGHSQHFASVRVPQAIEPGHIVKMVATAFQGDYIIADRLAE